MTPHASADIAPIPRRAIAYLIDAFIAAALAILLGGAVLVSAALAGPKGMPTIVLIGLPIVFVVLSGWFAVYTAMQAGKGSIGMRAQGVRMVSARDGGPVGFGRALLRNIVFGLACVIVVGYFTPLFDGSGRFQGWHDKAAGSLMLNARGSAAEESAPGDARAEPAIDATARSVDATMPSVEPAREPERRVAAPSAGPAWTAPPSVPPKATQSELAAGGSLIAFVPGFSHAAPPPQPAPVPPAASALVTQSAAHDPEDSSVDVEDTRISIPGHRLVFTWDDGTRVSVSRRTIFGRNPTPEEGAVVAPVRDETLSLSKTHFEAAAETSGGWVRDRHSTNGMTLVRDGQRIACPAGQRVSVRLGDAIEIGERIVTIGGYA